MVILRHLFSYLIPGGFLLAIAAMLLEHEQIARWVLARVWLFPWGLGGAALLLGWRFNRSRLLFAMLLVLLADQGVRWFGVGDLALASLSPVIVLVVSVNLALLSFWRERGVFTGIGLIRLAFILVQPLLLAAVFHAQGPEPPGKLTAFSVLLPLPLLGNIPPVFLVCLLSALVLLFRFHRNRDPLDHGFLWAMLASMAATFVASPGVLASYYFGVAGLILIVATLEAAHRMAFRDELTGLPARRALNEALDKLGSRYTVAMVDIDHFKKFNDRYGHDVGDQVLAMVAARLRRVGGGGRPFRYGGEEFTILFSGKEAEEALPHLEKLRREVATAGFNIRSTGRPKRKPAKGGGKGGRSGNTVSVTVSIGVAHRNGRDTPPMVIKAADKALYRAKEAGRNQVVA